MYGREDFSSPSLHAVHVTYAVFVVTTQIEASEDMDEEMDTIIERQMTKHSHRLLHSVLYY